MYEPYMMLLLYKNQGTLYIEKAAIENHKLQSFVPLRKAEMLKLANNIGISHKCYLSGRMTDTIVFYKPEHEFMLAWRYEKGEANLFYDPKLNIKDGIKKLPFILFIVKDDKLITYAYKEWKEDETILYYLPLHNIHSGNDVCMGNVSLKYTSNDSFKTFIAKIEYLFFTLKGTSIHNSRAFPTNINILHTQIDEVFPIDELVPIGKKLKHILK